MTLQVRGASCAVRSALVLVLAVGAGVATSACKSPTSTSSTPTPTTVTLAPGQSAQADGTTVTFVGVLSDSRCPIDAMCVWAGEAMAAFQVSARGLDQRLELALFDAAKRRGSVRGLAIEFTTLAPATRAATPIRPEDYRATVVITRQ